MRSNADSKRYSEKLADTTQKMRKNKFYNLFLWLFGFFTMLSVLIVQAGKGTLQSKRKLRSKQIDEYIKTEDAQQSKNEAVEEIRLKNEFFGITMNQNEFDKQVEAELLRQALERIEEEDYQSGSFSDMFVQTLKSLLNNKVFLLFSLILSLPMHILVWIYNMPYIKYIFERMIMMIFVLLGVTIVVFTIIYISPTDPAASVLGPEATEQTIENFRKVYGLNDPYHIQLWNTFRKVFTFDLGNSYVGNEDIAEAITRRFPPTFQLGVASLVIAVAIAMPAGIISAIKQNSGLDYFLMFIALLGLSIPNFWMGLIMILEFSVKMKILPATFQQGNMITYLMPALTVGTGMSAALARMTRSSMLEVARQDYVMMARAKGLKERYVTIHYILKNALLPIITILGMQFAATLSGAATTEKVFNIRGMCEYIATRVLLPDTPVVIGSVIYIAAAISISNLIVDLLYTFADPRLKTKLKNY